MSTTWKKKRKRSGRYLLGTLKVAVYGLIQESFSTRIASLFKSIPTKTDDVNWIFSAVSHRINVTRSSPWINTQKKIGDYHRHTYENYNKRTSKIVNCQDRVSCYISHMRSIEKFSRRATGRMGKDRGGWNGPRDSYYRPVNRAPRVVHPQVDGAVQLNGPFFPPLHNKFFDRWVFSIFRLITTTRITDRSFLGVILKRAGWRLASTSSAGGKRERILWACRPNSVTESISWSNMVILGQKSNENKANKIKTKSWTSW